MTKDWRKLLSGTGIRGADEELTDEFAAKFGYAFAQWLARELNTTTDLLTIAVGRDTRVSGRRLAKALIRGFTAADCDVLDCGMCASPAVFMTLYREGKKADGAVMITGGHCAAGMNGFKLGAQGGAPDADEIAEMLVMAAQLRLPDRLVRYERPMEPYAEYLAAFAREELQDDALKPLIGLHVIVDASNGAGGFYAGFLEELGADAYGSINQQSDGRFPDHDPDIAAPGALEALAERVVAEEADLGVMFDADCERAAIVDGNGKIITGNRLIALVSALLLDDQPGATIVTDSVTSSGLTRFINEWGGVHYRFKRGNRNVIEEARRLDAEGINCPLAIETSGHAAFRDNYFLDDGMYLATLMVCRAYDLKRSGKTLSMLIDDLSEPVESIEIRLRIASDDIKQAARDVIEVVLSNTLENREWRLATDSREGVRILFNLDGGVENAWFQLRMSVHDPAVMVLNAESDVEGGIRNMLAQLHALLAAQECELELAPLAAAAK